MISQPDYYFLLVILQYLARIEATGMRTRPDKRGERAILGRACGLSESWAPLGFGCFPSLSQSTASPKPRHLTTPKPE